MFIEENIYKFIIYKWFFKIPCARVVSEPTLKEYISLVFLRISNIFFCVWELTKNLCMRWGDITVPIHRRIMSEIGTSSLQWINKRFPKYWSLQNKCPCLMWVLPGITLGHVCVCVCVCFLIPDYFNILLIIKCWNHLS